MNDPTALLEFLPEAVAIEASTEDGPHEKLEELIKFADRLKRSANMLLNTIRRDDERPVLQQKGEESETPENSIPTLRPENVSSSSYARNCVDLCSDTSGGEDGVHQEAPPPAVARMPTRKKESIASYVAGVRAGGRACDSSDDDDDGGDGDIGGSTPTGMKNMAGLKDDRSYNTSSRRSPQGTQIQPQSVIQSSEVQGEYHNPREKRSRRRCPSGRSARPSAVFSSEAEEDYHVPQYERSKPPVFGHDQILQNREPRVLSPGYKGNLKDSCYLRSVGLTRHVLNENLDELGLSACFGQAVVSRRGNSVSQITLNQAWNDLPHTTNETLEWWLGEGKRRFALTEPMDPVRHPNHSDIPIFWAAKGCKNGGGGTPCHYIGHFRCIRRERLQNAILFKKKSREALIEFQFVKFDDDLAVKMAMIGM